MIIVKRILFIFHLLGFLFPLPLTATERPTTFLIRPGAGVGKIDLGIHRNLVIQKMGNPQKTYQHNWHGKLLTLNIWNLESRDRELPATPYRHCLTVLFQTNKVIQIGVSSPKFATREGVSTKTRFGYIGWKFKKLRRIDYTLPTPPSPGPSDGGLGLAVYDSLKLGIAFTRGPVYTGPNVIAAEETPDSIIVHPRGQKFVSFMEYGFL